MASKGAQDKGQTNLRRQRQASGQPFGSSPGRPCWKPQAPAYTHTHTHTPPSPRHHGAVGSTLHHHTHTCPPPLHPAAHPRTTPSTAIHRSQRQSEHGKLQGDRDKDSDRPRPSSAYMAAQPRRGKRFSGSIGSVHRNRGPCKRYIKAGVRCVWHLRATRARGPPNAHAGVSRVTRAAARSKRGLRARSKRLELSRQARRRRDSIKVVGTKVAGSRQQASSSNLRGQKSAAA